MYTRYSNDYTNNSNSLLNMLTVHTWSAVTSSLINFAACGEESLQLSTLVFVLIHSEVKIELNRPRLLDVKQETSGFFGFC